MKLPAVRGFGNVTMPAQLRASGVILVTFQGWCGWGGRHVTIVT
jgi:hypothetical protein